MYEENVRRGMAWCDKNFGLDWLWRVNVETLQLSSCTKCVLGQLYGDYGDACDVFGFFGEDDVPLGFDITSEMADREGGEVVVWERLTATWKRLILEAREQRKLTLASQPLEAETERVLQTAN